ncbi:MAG: hypothetical protein IPL61_06240 [Myxococcales bacterium]|nr:hypothetical protein [Myxococcales bacterium]
MRTPWLRPLALVAAMSLASGCVMRGDGRYLAYGVDAAVTAVGLAVATQTEVSADPDPACDLLCDGEVDRALIRTGWAVAALGMVLIATNYVANLDVVESPGAPSVVVDVATLPPLPVTPTADPEAVRMTRQARRAGLAGTCAAVQQLAPRVRAADPIYYRGVFAVDPPIVACL